MRFFSSLATLALAASATAAAVGSKTTVVRKGGVDLEVRADPKKCLCQSDVDTLVAAYKRMINGWKDEDAVYLADDFLDWSESINLLIPPNGLGTGFPIFPTKQSFIDHQHTQPDNLPLTVERVGPWNCEEIALIWNAEFSVSPNIPKGKVRGLTIITGTHTTGSWQIKRLDVEFNNIQYLNNIGGTVTRPTPPATTTA